MTHLRIMRQREWAFPIRPVQREVLHSLPDESESSVEGSNRPPLLFVAGYGQGAWIFAERWLEHAAQRGFAAYAMSLRGNGESGSAPKTTLRAYAHDVVQVAARLPRQVVLIGHGVGALAVARAMARYPARAGVLVCPVFGGVRTAFTALRRNPVGTAPAIVGGRLRLRRNQVFGREVGPTGARTFGAKLRAGTAPLVQWQLLFHRAPEPPVGDPPMLVVGTPNDHVVPRSALEKVARRYNVAPLLFPGMGHDLMLEARWQEPIDAILDWLDKPADAHKQP